MPLTQQQATQIAQLLGQYQDAARFIVEANQTPNATAAAIITRMGIPVNPLGGAIYGMTALSFVYTFDAVVKEQNYPPSIVNLVNVRQLKIILNVQDAQETQERACLRHLRNCFAHGRFVIGGSQNNPQITLHDQNRAGIPTFDAQCDAVDVFDLAEKVLVEAHNIAAAIALQAAAPTAAAPPAPALIPPREN